MNYLLVAPAYDDLTMMMREWLEALFQDFEFVNARGSARLITADDASWATLRSHLESTTSGEGITLIFYGHGDDIGFLTSPNIGSVLPDGKHGRLVTQGDFHAGAVSVVVGFCCSSATVFGRDLHALGKSGTFIGFTEDIGFVHDRPYRQAFERPMRKFILDDGWNIENLRKIYLDEYDKWLDGEFSDGPAADIVCMFLDQHLRCMQGYQD